jgi:hypothetical protein
VVAYALLRSSLKVAEGLSPVAAFGVLLLAVAVWRGGPFLAMALGVGGATYVGAIVVAGRHVDVAAPLVALLLLLCGELAAWSVDARVRIEADEQLAWRRGAAVGALALVGLAAATLVVALSAVQLGHGLAWTIAGAVAAVAAIGLVRRSA